MILFLRKKSPHTKRIRTKYPDITQPSILHVEVKDIYPTITQT